MPRNKAAICLEGHRDVSCLLYRISFLIQNESALVPGSVTSPAKLPALDDQPVSSKKRRSVFLRALPRDLKPADPGVSEGADWHGVTCRKRLPTQPTYPTWTW